MDQYTATRLEPEAVYHIYNRANGSELLFRDEENYLFFLHKYKQYILPVADTFCYCLMPNHFHFLIRIKPEQAILEGLRVGEKAEKTFPKFETLERLVRRQDSTRFKFQEKLISRQFASFFSCYTQAFNKQQNRKGSLFMKNFKRRHVNDENYLRKLVHYIHHNPIAHGFCEKPENWQFSSFNGMLSEKPSWLNSNEVIEWFDDTENYIYCHRQPPKLIFDL